MGGEIIKTPEQAIECFDRFFERMKGEIEEIVSAEFKKISNKRRSMDEIQLHGIVLSAIVRWLDS